MRINSSGNVGIGVTSLSSSSRLTLLESAGNAQTLEIKGANSGGAGSQPGIKFTASSGDNIGGIFGDTNTDAFCKQVAPSGYESTAQGMYLSEQQQLIALFKLAKVVQKLLNLSQVNQLTIT